MAMSRASIYNRAVFLPTKDEKMMNRKQLLAALAAAVVPVAPVLAQAAKSKDPDVRQAAAGGEA